MGLAEAGRGLGRQGYFRGRPHPPKKIEDWLRKRAEAEAEAKVA